MRKPKISAARISGRCRILSLRDRFRSVRMAGWEYLMREAAPDLR